MSMSNAYSAIFGSEWEQEESYNIVQSYAKQRYECQMTICDKSEYFKAMSTTFGALISLLIFYVHTFARSKTERKERTEKHKYN